MKKCKDECEGLIFIRVLKTVTEDEYGNDLGAWNDKIERTSMVATFNEKFEILSIA